MIVKTSSGQTAFLLLVISLCMMTGKLPEALAQDSHEETEQGAYFTIQEEARKQIWMRDPQALLERGVEALATTASRLSLLKWKRHDEAPPQAPFPYSRRKHFGTWINDPTDSTCFNTRAKVLIRTSEVPVGLKDKNRCIVESGQWEDPYTGKVHTSARDVQIDHMVPLKNAFTSGAWAWNVKQRCLYANFMANEYHLKPVDGFENMSKGDRSPDKYLPPQGSYVCQYLRSWLKIKMIWKLDMTVNEAEAIRQSVKNYGCSSNTLVISDKELTEQRTATKELQNICQRYADRFEFREQSLRGLQEEVSFLEAEIQ